MACRKGADPFANKSRPINARYIRSQFRDSWQRVRFVRVTCVQCSLDILDGWGIKRTGHSGQSVRQIVVDDVARCDLVPPVAPSRSDTATRHTRQPRRRGCEGFFGLAKERVHGNA